MQKRYQISIIFAFLLLLQLSASVAGPAATHKFIGTLYIKGGGRYAYILYCTDSAGRLQGYSITDPQGPAETRSAISGHIDTTTHQLIFSEDNMLETRSGSSDADMCYVHARLMPDTKKSMHRLKGSFTGYTKNGKVVCDRGSILLYSSEDIMARLFKKSSEIATKSKQPAFEQLRSGASVIVKTKAPHARIEVWDDTIEDGDIISLYQNGRTLLDHYTLLSQKKEIGLSLSPGKADTIMLVAENLGTAPPNTAALSLWLAGLEHRYLATTQPGQPVYIILGKE